MFKPLLENVHVPKLPIEDDVYLDYDVFFDFVVSGIARGDGERENPLIRFKVLWHLSFFSGTD
jgi:hypothetical protein